MYTKQKLKKLPYSLLLILSLLSCKQGDLIIDLSNDEAFKNSLQNAHNKLTQAEFESIYDDLILVLGEDYFTVQVDQDDSRRIKQLAMQSANDSLFFLGKYDKLTVEQIAKKAQVIKDKHRDSFARLQQEHRKAEDLGKFLKFSKVNYFPTSDINDTESPRCQFTVQNTSENNILAFKAKFIASYYNAEIFTLPLKIDFDPHLEPDKERLLEINLYNEDFAKSSNTYLDGKLQIEIDTIFLENEYIISARMLNAIDGKSPGDNYFESQIDALKFILALKYPFLGEYL